MYWIDTPEGMLFTLVFIYVPALILTIYASVTGERERKRERQMVRRLIKAQSQKH